MVLDQDQAAASVGKDRLPPRKSARVQETFAFVHIVQAPYLLATNVAHMAADDDSFFVVERRHGHSKALRRGSSLSRLLWVVKGTVSATLLLLSPSRSLW